MYANEIREATAEEMAIYNKVEGALNDEEWDTLFDLVADEPMDNLLDNKIENAEALAIIEAKGLTVAEVCAWYFIG